MKIPKTFLELLKERIKFTENFLSSTYVINNDNRLIVSKFIIANEDFKYCKKLYIQLLNEPNNSDLKILFRNLSYKLLFEIIHSLNTQEYKCVISNGLVFPAVERQVLPKEISDYISNMRIAIVDIFVEVEKLCKD